MKTRSLALSAFLLAGVLAGAELVEKILARVNDRLITNSEFQRRVTAASHAPQASSDSAQIKREVLEDLIKEKLLEERAKEMSVSASDEEIETAVERVKRQYNLATDQEFDAALASSNMTREDLRRQMRQTIILQKVIGRDVTSKLEISEDMLRLEYERQKEKLYRVPESARVSEIVIRFPANDAAARERAVARLEEARAKLAAGTPFADVSEDLKKRIGENLYDKRFGEYVAKLRREAYVKIYDPELVKLDSEKKS